jgi:carbonic anhydrase/acetyltransferase-like protein (isoleucine patch superfamily)
MPQIDQSVYLADGSQVTGNVKIGKNSSIWLNAVIRGDMAPIEIGEETNIQDLSVLHVHKGIAMKIGKGCTVGHAVILHSCEIGDNTLIGMGSIIMDRVQIGKNCIIGAGTLITQGKIIPDESVVFGNPAKIQKKVTEQEIISNRENAREYVEMAETEKRNRVH